MKRFIKAAVAVAAFGLAAAICAPAQARSYDIPAGQDGTDGLSHVLGGLTFGLLDEGNVQLGNMGDQGPVFGMRDDQGLPSSMTGGWRVGTERLWWTLTGTAEELAGTSAVDPTPGASVGDPAPGASVGDPAPGASVVDPAPGTSVVDPAPGTSVVDPAPGTSVGDPAPGTSVVDPAPGASVVDPAPGSPLDGTAQNGPLPAAQGSQNLSDIFAAVPATTTSAAETAQTSAEAVAGLSEKRAEIGGLVDAANQAVPQGAEQAGTLAPLVGTVSPAEAEPVAGAVAPIVRSAAADELAPLVGNSGEAGAKALTGAVHSLADTTMSTTRVAAE
ncbi:hypothetical protein [Streptosporangium roseum]|uniref:Uncharacterized protein n=1 Tax=Streptosporangium roseum (strain ATCC 12428 / DSM 43021 / JCM 3005 / KCTC 9067 / NCIMB 10171 / NRRL 2505 / NI 9100) TaxID=479432 RepID=D2B7Q0_STRRD|nr:hypothetical protein [Streptosporangium roseum]ACZ91571.1 hypothetical protein Sros_8939 [Streptosporangium roseum DSM 43021]